MTRSPLHVALVDTGGANLASIEFALGRLGAASDVVRDARGLESATHVILPGVGAAKDGMGRLRESGLDRAVKSLDKPVLGICLGMQLLFTSSEEGDVACLDIIPGRVARLAADRDHAVPHMGWNTFAPLGDEPLFAGISERDFVYFVHSYAAPVTPETTARCEYGRSFAAAVRKENFAGVQFHPERSAQVGARILRNFLGLS